MKDPQAQILNLLMTGRPIESPELIRECQGWDFRKSICRLKNKGFHIISEPTPGKRYFTYRLLQPINEQERLL